MIYYLWNWLTNFYLAQTSKVCFILPVLNIASKCYVKKKELSQVTSPLKNSLLTLQVYVDNLKRVIDVENQLGLVGSHWSYHDVRATWSRRRHALRFARCSLVPPACVLSRHPLEMIACKSGPRNNSTLIVFVLQ